MVDAATEIATLRAALAAFEARADAIAAEAAHAKAVLSGSEALIAHLRLEIESCARGLHGHRSERKERLLDQLELQLEELEAAVSKGRGASRSVSGEGENRGRRLRAPQADPQ